MVQRDGPRAFPNATVVFLREAALCYYFVGRARVFSIARLLSANLRLCPRYNAPGNFWYPAT